MNLTKEEQEILEGKYSRAAQKSMEILVGVGECYDADVMIPVSSVHILHGRANAGDGGALFYKELAKNGGEFVVFTDTNPSGIDPLGWEKIGLPKEFAQKQIDMTNDVLKMGAYPSNSCVPYLLGNLPRMGEHIAWCESSAVIFANSVLGARCNREGSFTSLASAITGKTPQYGYHLKQNRYGDLRIIVKANLNDLHDYGILGCFVGKVAGDRNPVITNLPPTIPVEKLIMFGAAAATFGGVALYHIVGITPEAPTEEAVFVNDLKTTETYEFTNRNFQETEAGICTATGKYIDMVVLGCPHATIREIKRISHLLAGKRISTGVDFWIMTSTIIKEYAGKTGLINNIVEAGGKIVCDTCPSSFPQGLLKERGYKTAATDSPKMAYYMGGVQEVPSYFGSTEQCIDAAMSGFWR